MCCIQFARDNHVKYGPVFQASIAAKRYIFVSGKDNVKQVWAYDNGDRDGDDSVFE